MLLILGQLTLVVGFAMFIYNFFFLDNILFIAILTIVLFLISLVLNISYLLKRRK